MDQYLSPPRTETRNGRASGMSRHKQYWYGVCSSTTGLCRQANGTGSSGGCSFPGCSRPSASFSTSLSPLPSISLSLPSVFVRYLSLSLCLSLSLSAVHSAASMLRTASHVLTCTCTYAAVIWRTWSETEARVWRKLQSMRIKTCITRLVRQT